MTNVTLPFEVNITAISGNLMTQIPIRQCFCILPDYSSLIVYNLVVATILLLNEIIDPMKRFNLEKYGSQKILRSTIIIALISLNAFFAMLHLIVPEVAKYYMVFV